MRLFLHLLLELNNMRSRLNSTQKQLKEAETQIRIKDQTVVSLNTCSNDFQNVRTQLSGKR